MTRPARLPAFSVASGIIESTSITSSAPAAKPSIAAFTSGPTTLARRVAAEGGQGADDGDDDPQAGAPSGPTCRPPRMSLAEPIPSGRLEMKIATSRATLTPSPAASPMPSTACSGIPSSSEPSASGSAAGATAVRPPIRSTAAFAAKKASAPTASPTATQIGPAISRPSCASSNATLEISAPAPKASTAPTTPAMPLPDHAQDGTDHQRTRRHRAPRQRTQHEDHATPPCQGDDPLETPARSANGQVQLLTAPAIPSTKYFCSTMNTTTTGMKAITMPAAMVAMSAVLRLVNWV